MKEHPTELYFEYQVDKGVYEQYRISPENLANKLSNLRYDSLAEYLYVLFEKLESDAKKDLINNKPILASLLNDSAILLKCSTKILTEAWDICKQHIPTKVCGDCGKISNTCEMIYGGLVCRSCILSSDEYK